MSGSRCAAALPTICGRRRREREQAAFVRGARLRRLAGAGIMLTRFRHAHGLKSRRRAASLSGRKVMKKFGMKIALVALLAGVAGFSTPSRAETGQVSVVFT